jgi:transposase InsO family protein
VKNRFPASPCAHGGVPRSANDEYREARPANVALRGDVRAAVFDWTERWYNRRRRHSSLGLSPLEYESQHYDGHLITNP